MNKKFTYTLNQYGYPIAYGYLNFENELNGTEPFTGFDIQFYKKDMSTGEWIYLPDVTPVNKEIIDVRYDWQEMKAYITIADQFQPGPHEFDCTETWADALYIIRSRDRYDSLFYVDPPYYNSNMGHYDGYSINDFEELLQTLASLKGRFILSSYPSDILQSYTDKNGWQTKSFDSQVSVNGKAKRKAKTEVLTMNF